MKSCHCRQRITKQKVLLLLMKQNGVPAFIHCQQIGVSRRHHWTTITHTSYCSLFWNLTAQLFHHHLHTYYQWRGLILHRPLGPSAPKINTNDWLRIGSTFHSLHAIAAEASPVKLPGNKNPGEKSLYDVFLLHVYMPLLQSACPRTKYFHLTLYHSTNIMF